MADKGRKNYENDACFRDSGMEILFRLMEIFGFKRSLEWNC